MASTATDLLRLQKQAVGDNLNTWGTVLNDNAFELIEDAIAGVTTIAVEADVTLTSTNYAADQARSAALIFTGTGGFTVTAPSSKKLYLIRNECSSFITMSNGGTTVNIPAGQTAWVFTDGTDFFKAEPTDFASQKITNVADPTSNQDGATKKYVDDVAFTANSGVLPGQTGNADKYLYTDGTTASWVSVNTLANRWRFR